MQHFDGGLRPHLTHAVPARDGALEGGIQGKEGEQVGEQNCIAKRKNTNLCGFQGIFQLTPAHHQIKNPTGSPVGFFLPKPACSLGFPRVLADFVVFPGVQKSTTFTLSGPIVSVAESTPNGPKSARDSVSTLKNQSTALHVNC